MHYGTIMATADAGEGLASIATFCLFLHMPINYKATDSFFFLTNRSEAYKDIYITDLPIVDFSEWNNSYCCLKSIV